MLSLIGLTCTDTIRIILLISMVTLMCFSGSSDANHGCIEPPDQHLHAKYSRLEASNHHIRSLHSHRDHLPDLSSNLTVTRISSYRHQECVDRSHESDEKSARSLCPWFLIKTYDPERYPRELVEAQCSCNGACLIASAHTGCEKIYYNIRVLRRQPWCDHKGYYHYEQAYHRLAVGCICAVHHQS